MSKTSFVLHLDSLSILDEMPDEMIGRFLKILYKYKLNGSLPKMDFAMKIAVTPFINQFVRDDEKYSNTIEKRALAGSLGGKQKLANASKSNQEVANLANEMVGHNGDKFDLAWIRTRCLFHKIEMFPAYVTIDTLKIARSKFRFNSNRLNYIADFLGLGQKIKTEYSLWKDILLKKDNLSLY